MVDRRTVNWGEAVVGLVSRVALLSEALSLMAPMRSLTFVVRPIKRARERQLRARRKGSSVYSIFYLLRNSERALRS